MLAPGFVQPGDALMQPLGFGDQLAGFSGSSRVSCALSEPRSGGSAPCSRTWFSLRSPENSARWFNSQASTCIIRVVVFQPLGRKRKAHEGILTHLRFARAGSEHGAHLVGQNQRFGIERLDESGGKDWSCGPYATQDRPGARRPPLGYGYFPSNFWLLSHPGTDFSFWVTIFALGLQVRASEPANYAMISGSSVSSMIAI